MLLKTRLILSALLAVLVMMPLIISMPHKLGGAIIFMLIVFIPIFIMTSLFNIRMMVLKVSVMSIVLISLAFKFYMSYFVQHQDLSKSLVMSVVFAGVFALIFRGTAMLVEKKELPLNKENQVDEEEPK